MTFTSTFNTFNDFLPSNVTAYYIKLELFIEHNYILKHMERLNLNLSNAGDNGGVTMCCLP